MCVWKEWSASCFERMGGVRREGKGREGWYGMVILWPYESEEVFGLPSAFTGAGEDGDGDYPGDD